MTFWTQMSQVRCPFVCLCIITTVGLLLWKHRLLIKTLSLLIKTQSDTNS